MINQPNSVEEFKTNYIATRNEDIDEIIRGEISAVDAYKLIFDQITESPEVSRVEEFYNEHLKSLEFWKNEAQSHSHVPDKDSGLWGIAVDTFVQASKIFGDKATLMAIKRGEEHGLENYKKMLNSEKLTHLQKSEIRYTFIPRQERHITSLAAMIKLQ